MPAFWRIIGAVRTQIVTALVAIGAFAALGEWHKRYDPAPVENARLIEEPGLPRRGQLNNPPRRRSDVVVAQYLPAADSPTLTPTEPSSFPFVQPTEAGAGAAAPMPTGAGSPAAPGSNGAAEPAPGAIGPPAAAPPLTPPPAVSAQVVPLPAAPLPAAPLPVQETLPIGDAEAADRIQVRVADELVSITAQDAPLAAVLALLARHHGLNIVSPPSVTQSISVTLNDVPLVDAFNAILTVNGYTWAVQNNILFVTALDSKLRGAPGVQGRVLKVFPLNYVSALDVDKIVKGLLSPVGQSFTLESNPIDQRKTQDQLVVEDLPSYVDRIEQYIHGVDFQPRQVVVEARILQVKLTDNMKHGINFERLLEVAHANVTLATPGFASATASPAGLITIEGPDVNSVIEALNATTDTKTLANSKLAVLNGQKARLQIGGQIGYLTSTSTMTTTVQTVNFLDTGVILEVTPMITADGQVLLTVKPQVSTGRINATTTLPESETTEVETHVMLADGEAVVIGGLINEKDVENENKLPFLGNIKYIGWLFRRKVFERERSEVIIVLQPRIVCEVPGHRQADPRPVQQAMTPIFAGSLVPIDRAIWEPPMPSAATPYRAPRPPIVSFETVDDPLMGLPQGTPSSQIYPPIPPLPSEELIPTPPSVEDAPPQGAAFAPTGRTENAFYPAPVGPPLQNGPAQYVPAQYFRPSEPQWPTQQAPAMRGPSSIIPLPPAE